MLRIIAIVAAALVIGYVIFHAAPRAVRQAQLTDIGELTNDPSRYDGKRVAVRGMVVDATGVLGHGEYRVRQLDGGSEIVVITNSGVPPANSVVTVRGVVKQALVVGSTQYAVIIQDNRHGAGT